MMSMTAADTLSWVDAGDKQFAEAFIRGSQKNMPTSHDSIFAFNFEEIKVTKMLKQQNKRKIEPPLAGWHFRGETGVPTPMYLLPKPFPPQVSQGLYTFKGIFSRRGEAFLLNN